MAKRNGKADEMDKIPNAKPLEEIVERLHQINMEKKELSAEAKALCTEAWGPYGYSARVLKQLAAEKDMGEVAKEERRQYEIKLQEARRDLGMLLDTPLGEAAVQKIEKTPDDAKAPHKKSAGPATTKARGRKTPGPRAADAW